ncbi:MAG: hypothetical protein AAF614_03735 [Chloroflexota bacterium]
MTIQRFSYTPHPSLPLGLPLLDIRLHTSTGSTVASALVDSGAALNILPFDVGLACGLVWEEQTFPLNLGGILKGAQAYAVLLQTEIIGLPPHKLAFAWVNKPASQVRVLLGQVNFFQLFNVHFYGHEKAFVIETRE